MRIVFSMRLAKLLGLALSAVALLGLWGCASKSGKSTYQAQETGSAPRSYRPLKVKNSCYVEAVHFCDFYAARQVGGVNGWAKVLQWGDRQNDFTVRGGHAVVIYQLKDHLWVYDINNGFLSLSPTPDKKLDLTLVTPQVFKRYPGMNPAHVRYVDDQPQSPEKNAPVYSVKAATTQELHDALKVAIELGRFRPVRVIEFIAPVDSYLRACAVTVFRYGGKICIYSPLSGTRLVDAPLASIDNLAQMEVLVKSVIPDSQDVKWFQPAKTTVIR
ncbi:MAG: hypothetical protein WC661_21585 [Opitutaceae bacterium]|jgi:hypothetical protein